MAGFGSFLKNSIIAGLAKPVRDIFNNPRLSGGGVVASHFRPNTLITIGDSIVAQSDFGVAGSSISLTLTRTNNVVNVPQAGHPYISGQLAKVQGWSDTTFNNNQAVVTRIDANNWQYASVGANGTTTGGSVRNPNSKTDCGWVGNALRYSKQAPRLIYNAGVDGDNCLGVIARLSGDVIAKMPGYCHVAIGTNDINFYSVAQITAWQKQICTTLRDAGIYVIFSTILPYGSGASNYTPTLNERVLECNNIMLRWIPSQIGMRVNDFYSWVVDPAASPIQPLAGWMQDGLHPAWIAGDWIGRQWAAANADLFPPVNMLAMNGLDNRVLAPVGNANTNMFPYLPNVATGGSVSGTGATGSLPLGFRASTAGSSVMACSGVARTVANDGDAIGYNASVTFTPTAANDTFTLGQNGSTGWAANCVIGNYYSMEFTVSITGVSGSTLSKFYASAQFVIDGVNYFAYESQPTNTKPPASDMKQMVFRTAPFKMTGTTETNVVLQTQTVFSATGSPVTVAIGRFTFREYTSANDTIYY